MKGIRWVRFLFPLPCLCKTLQRLMLLSKVLTRANRSSLLTCVLFLQATFASGIFAASPQGLCTGCSLLGTSFPDTHVAYFLIFFKSLLKCYLLNRAHSHHLS